MPSLEDFSSQYFTVPSTAEIGRRLGQFYTPNEEKYKYIKNYNFIPERFLFHKIDDEEELYMGIELEIDGGEGKSDEIAKQCITMLGENNIYCKHDGSLQNGFEIVSHPCTLEYHKNLGYQNLFEFLVKKKYRSHDTTTCGLHIHFNKDYFGKDKIRQDLNIGKLLYLFEKYWNKVVAIARRNSNSYSRRFTLSEDETILDLYAKSKNSNKYGAINMQHKDSFEIRIFKGTLAYETFLNTLEFVHEIVRYVRGIDIYDIQTITWDDINNNFSQGLKDYIMEREDKEKSKKEAENSFGYETAVTSIPSLHAMNYHELIGQMRTELINSMNSYTLNVEPTEDAIREQINELKRRERRERNHMAQTQLRREISHLERELSLLRRSGRRTEN